MDVPLARLFVHVTRPPEAGAKGAARARSASEKFFYQRLQTLAATKDIFQINSSLPIPFNERSEMEVDFLYAEKNLVIELDGDQHLDDKDAYRRDRAKDALLQDNGYLVLRFLTCDLGKNLDHILDMVQRVMARR